VHVKLLMQWPAFVQSGQMIGARVSALDLLPTIAQATRGNHTAAVSSLDSRYDSLDGRSLLPLLQRTGQSRYNELVSMPSLSKDKRVLYWRFNATCSGPKRALLQGSYKWLQSKADQNAGNICKFFSFRYDSLKYLSCIHT
jgi:hypothetical protein